MAAYAIVRSGGKQYRVHEGATIDVERLTTPEGERVDLGEVLLVAEGERITVGTPTVPDAKVVAEVVSHGRGGKVTVFRYKAKTRYRKKTGHRQDFTRLAIQRIQVGEEEEKPVRRRRPRKAKAQEPVAGEAASEEPAVSQEPAPDTEAEKKPAPRQRRQKSETTSTGE